MQRFVIIGGGVAGTTAAEVIRKRLPDADITIVEAEGYPLYSRVLLRNVVKGQIERERVFLKKPTWYDEHKIELLTHTRVVRIDVQNQFVETDSARELPFDKLLIATGGDVRLIAQDLRGVSYFRTLDDTDHLMQLLRSTAALPKETRHGVTLGSSFIALDYINLYHRFEIPQTVIMRGTGFWSSTLSRETSDMLIAHCKEKGVSFYVDQEDITLLGETELSGVRLKDGTEIQAQMLGVGIGIDADFALLKSAGLQVEKGILCNEFLETSVANVYTAGDVAEFNDTIVERRHVVGNWTNALMQGRAAGATMAGERTPFGVVTGYTTELLGLEMAFVGDTHRASSDNVRTAILGNNQALELFERNGRTVGAVLIGNVKARQAITDAIKTKTLYVAQ